MNRWWWSGIALAASLAVTAAFWLADIPALFLLLFLPLLFAPLGRRKVHPTHRTCPACGRPYADPMVEYCPRDGTRLP